MTSIFKRLIFSYLYSSNCLESFPADAQRNSKETDLIFYFRTNLGLLFMLAILSISNSQLLLGNNVQPSKITMANGVSSTALSPLKSTPMPQFDLLPVKQTGINFVNSLDVNHPYRFLYHSGMSCGGVAIGDIDGDDLPDIYLVSGPGKNKLFRQTGELTFEDITETAGVAGGNSWGTGVAMADIDNDNDLDIYVCNYDAPNLLYVNQGNGTFSEMADQYNLNIVDANLLPTFCDYDRDGDLDLYLLANHLHPPKGKPRKMDIVYREGRLIVPKEYERSYSQQTDERTGKIKIDRYGRADYLLSNDGTGRFTDVTHSAGVHNFGFGLSATWWDYNQDGWPDLYVGNDFQDPDRFYRNNKDGTFTNVIEHVVPHTTWYSMGADFGDINNDGRFDFLAADMSATTHFKQKTTMGNMSSFRWFLESARPRQYMRNALYLNTGVDRFMEIAELAKLADSDWSWTVKFADLDNDGWIDVYLTNGTARSSNFSDLAKLNDPFGKNAWDRYAHAPPRPEQNLVFRNEQDFRFEDSSKSWGLDHTGMSYAAVHSDLDRDGDLDLVVVNLDEPVSIYRNNLAKGNRVLIRLQGTRSNRFGVGATVRIETDSGPQVRQLIPVRGFLSSNEPLVHFGLGRNDHIKKLVVSWPSGNIQELTALPANRFYTITEPDNPATIPSKGESETSLFTASSKLRGITHNERKFDDFKLQPLLPNRLSQLGPGHAWGDVDGDGDDDLFIGGAAGQNSRLYHKSQDGKYISTQSNVFLEDSESEDMGALFFDADSDGDQDLYVVSGGVETISDKSLLRDRLYVNDGTGQFEKAPEGILPDCLESGSIVAANDFDRDGDLDLFVGSRVIPGQYPKTPNSQLLQNESGSFKDIIDELAPGLRQTGLVTSALWSDINGDGWSDLMITHEWGPIKVFRNQNGRLIDMTTEAGLANRSGWWNGIAARDVDGDGDLDYAVTNFGLNTKYHASIEKPVVLYYGDFDGSGRSRIIEGEFEKNTLFPIRGKSCSTSAMPHLGEKFPTFSKFASASLQEIYSTKCLADASRFEINTLQSGLLKNDGVGIFEFVPFPRFVQASPSFGVVFSEIDGDGKPDLYIVQNFFSPQPETGHMDGGLSVLLKGVGDGTFLPVWPDRSGLIIAGDATSATAADINNDGWPDFIVGVNDSDLVAFENRGSLDDTIIVVRLRGKVGNLTGIGARLQLFLSDGSSQSAEVHAGGGYLSQSPAAQVFGIPKSTHAERIDVTWPDGRSSTRRLGQDAEVVYIDQPL